ncbi:MULTISPECIES: TMEM165/GDT1 family protein [Thermoleptolyngbya]|uniref:TMEM165/GDT1 family protein n=1 Tax=Thermoleptolyngbya TaxID=2303528 RepID=UPI001CECBE33|nr:MULTISPECIES: TMEM165/GDT1 family protein [Thermoleptolyngbya]
MSLVSPDSILSSPVLTAERPVPPSIQPLAASSDGAADSTQPAPTAQPLRLRDEFGIFFSTFITIFLAEIGDKTQMTVLLMSAQSKAPWVVFLGAGSALIATSLCGVLLGKWLSTRISPRLLDKAAAVLLLVVAGMLVWDVIQG